MKLQLVELDSADNNTAEITCRRIYANLNSPPDYEAISYEWGSGRNYRTINLDASIVEVSDHLFEAFRALRYSDRKRLLWVDGFGLDQDTPELHLLRETFSRAKSVIIWLGVENSLTKTASEVMKSLAYIARERDMRYSNIVRLMIRERPSHGSLFRGTNDMVCVHGPLNEPKIYYLPRHLSSDDDTIFKFNEDRVWREIDGIFSNTYFGRAWILQEVATAAEVIVFRGKHNMPWPIFWAAYQGRFIFSFKRPVSSDAKAWDSNNWAVNDARERFRKHDSSDLATVLAALTYSKKTRPHDHIYAAMELARLPPNHQLLENQYKQTIEELFVNVASFIINDRNDLYLWGNKSTLGKRTLKIPTWVPEWTGHTDDFATEYYNPTFSRLVRGNYSIYGATLHVDVHILDTIEFCWPLESEDITQVVSELEHLFKRKGSTLLDRYIGGDLKLNRDEDLNDLTPNNRRLHSLANIFAIISMLKSCPNTLLQTLSNIGKLDDDNFEDSMLNIEAFWSAMNPTTMLRLATPVPRGEQLFISWLCMTGLRQKNFNIKDIAKGYGYWFIACLDMMTNDSTLDFLKRLCVEHLARSARLPDVEDECVFVTKEGYFGRSRLGEVRKGHVVAIVGGGYVPYILEKRDKNYALVSHAYVEGLMGLRELPTWMSIQRIGLV